MSGEELHMKEDENQGVKWIPIEELANVCEEKWMVERVFSKLTEKLENELS